MASAPSNNNLHKRNEALEAQVRVLEEELTELRRTLSLMKKIQEMKDSIAVLNSAIRDMPDSDIGKPPAALPRPGTGAAGGEPLVALGRTAAGPVFSGDEGIVDMIPLLHRTYVNLTPDGYWTYWEKLPDGRYKWNPVWRLNDADKDNK